jgi:hypothetical protein
MKIWFCCVLMLIALPALAQEAQAPATTAQALPEVLVLGLFHMANPGRDIVNMRADDMLTPKRQAEIAQVIDVLKKFRPTKIAIESEVGDDRIPDRYADYLSGRYELSRNETDQLGLRLAKEVGHKAVYPVDVDGDFPFQRLVNYARGSGHSDELDSMLAEVGRMVKAQGDYLASHSVLETLLYMNSDKKVAEDVGFYYREAAMGEPGDWPGADLVADWFRRNVRIYSNIMQLIDSPDERVLVIFGAGHLGWLQHDFASTPGVRLRKLSELVN